MHTNQNAIDHNGGLRASAFQQPAFIRYIAHALSYIFHPLFIPVYVTCFLMYWHTGAFAGFSSFDKIKILATIVVNLVFFPAVTVFLLWRLKFINSFFLRTQKERIIPYAAAMIFYFWCWYVLKMQASIPELLKQFLLGSFITVIVAWLVNIYSKISMHTLAVGGMFMFVSLVCLNTDAASGLYITITLLIAGAVGTSRLIVSDHHSFQIYLGFVLGVLSQLVAYWLQ